MHFNLHFGIFIDLLIKLRNSVHRTCYPAACLKPVVTEFQYSVVNVRIYCNRPPLLCKMKLNLKLFFYQRAFKMPTMKTNIL